MRLASLALLAAAVLLGAPGLSAQEGERAVLRGLLAAGRVPGARWPDFSGHLDDVNRLYASTGGSPVWFEQGRISPAGRAAIAALLGAGSHGLPPEDYDAAPLDSIARRDAAEPVTDQGRIDLMITVDLIRYLDDLRRGRTKGVVQSGSVTRARRACRANCARRAR